MEENEDETKENMEEEYMKYVNKNLFPCGKLYAISSCGLLRLFTIIFCLVAFILAELGSCPIMSSCFTNNYTSTYSYFSVISFLIFVTSLAIYVIYVIGFVQNIGYRPRVKAFAEVIYMAAAIFFYFFAVVFLIPRTSGVIEYQLSAAIGSFVLILITVNLALLLVRSNQSFRIDKSNSNSVNSMESEDRWVPTTTEFEWSDKETIPRLHSVRVRSSSTESVTAPMEEVDLTDNNVFGENCHSDSSTASAKEFNLDKKFNDNFSVSSCSLPSCTYPSTSSASTDDEKSSK
ncbi:uncharacterized protein [Centruroides vittatus]|uniref:uncharacterized protein n=1 Tax=Centruroides vittatus TaxID=120091 RepID=UPI00350F90E3